MMKLKNNPTSTDKRRAARSLGFYREEYAAWLEERGYRRGTIKGYTAGVGVFINLMRAKQLRARNLDAKHVGNLMKAMERQCPANGGGAYRFGVNRFIEYLSVTGAMTPIITSKFEDTPKGRLLADYDDYLRRQRGLRDSTVYACIRYADRFLTFRFKTRLGDLNKITVNDIYDFLHQFRNRRQPLRDKTPPTHLRNFFKYLFWSGKTRNNLADSVPKMRQAPSSGTPRHLSPDQVRQLIDAVKGDDVFGRRNYAMMLLISRLGLRAPELVAVQIDDIDWRRGEILIRGKGDLHDKMPLPQDVGEAIVDYIKVRRKSESRALFVTNRAPFPALADGSIINTLLRDAFKKTGLKPPTKYVGSHVLRHSLATDMLRNGATIDEIGDVLRHRSRMTTTIYAKYDLAALRELALPWPCAGGVK